MSRKLKRRGLRLMADRQPEPYNWRSDKFAEMLDKITGPRQVFPVGCMHKSLPRPKFNARKARGLTAYKVRKLFPRSCLRCPDCNADVIMYKSFRHYIAGDW